MTRNRIQTEQRILNAVGSILLDQGYPAVGVNAIARQAGCDKVLIYRYFGGFDELLLAFAETTTLWWEVDEIITETAVECTQIALPDFLQRLLNRYAETTASKSPSESTSITVSDSIPNPDINVDETKF